MQPVASCLETHSFPETHEKTDRFCRDGGDDRVPFPHARCCHHRRLAYCSPGDGANSSERRAGRLGG